MCLPPEISVSALPTFARGRNWRVVEELGSKAWGQSYVLREGVEQLSGPADGAAQDGCDRVASRRDSDHHVDAAELCAAGIKLPLQSPVVIYENDKKAFDPEHSSTPARYANSLLHGLLKMGGSSHARACLLPSSVPISLGNCGSHLHLVEYTTSTCEAF
jgi:hypothetical protein